MKIAALFFGTTGRLDLGFKRTGFDVIWANEYDETIWYTYRYHHKDTILNTKSIRDIENDEMPKNLMV